MNLLHPEVEITPGRRGKQGYQERDKMAGSAVLRLVNETPQENAYTVKIRCDAPFWQESWYKIRSADTPANAPLAGQADILGHNGHSIKVFVPRGGTRDILIRFDVPERPESRAGRYDYVIEVETQVTQAQEGGARRRDRLTSIPAIANVRPFYKWSLDLTPEQQRATRRRRAGDFEVIVTNEGNDWLYCDLLLPRPKDLLLECPTLRLAVPPPEPGEMLPNVDIQEGAPGTQRVVPLRATTRLKAFRGDPTPQPLTISATRVDAPSLAPPAEDGYLSLGSVVAVAANPPDVRPAPTDRVLVYMPPIPAKLLDFFSRGAGHLRNWIAPVLMLAIAIPMLILVIQKLQFKVKLETKGFAEAGKPLVIGGPGVLGAKIVLTGKVGSADVVRVLEGKPVDLRSVTTTSRCKVMIPKDIDHFQGTLRVERAGGIFSILPPFLAVASDINNFKVGTDLVVQVPTADPLQGTFQSGQEVRVNCTGFGGRGTVHINDIAVKPVGWTLDHVTLRVPDRKPGTTLKVDLLPESGTPIVQAGSITIAPAPVALVPTTKGGKEGTAAGGSAGGGGAGGGGGGQKAGAVPVKPKITAGGGAKVAKVISVTQTHLRNPSQTQPSQTQPLPAQQPPAPPPLTAEDYLLRSQYEAALGTVKDQDTPRAHAIRAIAYAQLGPATLGQAQSEVGLADGGATSPADKALVLVAKGWIARGNHDFRQAGTHFDTAAKMDQALLVKVSQIEGVSHPTTAINNLKGMEGSLSPTEKEDVEHRIRKLKDSIHIQ